MRGFQVSPAGVDIYLVFEESISQRFFNDALAEWGALQPRIISGTVQKYVSEHPQTCIVITERRERHLQADFPGMAHSLMVSDEEVGHERLTVEVTLCMLKQLAGSLNLFHAAALGDPQNKSAMIMVGPSGRGKTTASKFLGQHFTYLSDETAIVQHDFHLRPYPKPLSVITEGHEAKQQIDPQSLGISTADPSDFTFKLHHVILLNRQDEPVEPRLQRVALADALLEIVQQTSGLVRTENGIDRLIELIQHCGGAVELVYTEIAETLPLLQSLMSGQLQLPVENVDIQSEQADSVEISTDNECLSRMAGSAGYLVDERMLLTVEDRLIEISPFAADIWIELKNPLTPDQLRTNLQEIYGPIPQHEFDRVIEELRVSRIIR